MDRRRFVAAVGSGLCCTFAGCVGSESGTEADGTEYALKLIRISDDGIRVEFAVTPGNMSNEMWSVVSDALEGTAKTYGYTAIRDGRYVEYGGRFYRISVEETGEKTHERPVLLGEVVEDETAEREAVEIATYPREDGTAVRKASAEGRYVLRNRDPDVSDILPEPKYEYVEYRDDVIRLSVEERELTETEYTYTATKVADSGTAFREFVREKVVDPWFDRTNLSDGQRDILEESRTGRYAELGDLSEAYRSLLERIFEGELPEETTGEHIGFEDSIYRAQLKVASS